MATFIAVIKIIGIVILYILAFLMLLILVLLFAPVRYKVSGSYEEDLDLKGKITYLLHLLVVDFSLSDGFKWDLKIFGIKIRLKKKNDKEKDDNKSDGANREDKDKKEDEASGHKVGNEKSAESGDDKDPDEDKGSARGINKIKQYVELLEQDSTKAAWETCRKRLGKLLRLLVPKYMDIDIRYGMDDPYMTSVVMAVCNVFYIYFDRCINVMPVYDRKITEAKGRIRGSIKLAPVLWHLLLVFADRDCRVFLKRFKSIRNG